MLINRPNSNTSIVSKTSAIHIENYYELWYNSQNFFQYDIYRQHFDKVIKNKTFSNKSIPSLNEAWNDVHDEWFILNGHNHLYQLTFYNFFIENKIDIPSCFKNSTSLLRPQKELTFLKLITYFMRHGLKLKTQNSFVVSLNNFFSTHYSKKNNTSVLSWQFIFFTLQNSFYTSQRKYNSVSKYINNTISYNHYLNSSSKNISPELNIYNLLYKNMLELFPIFSFYIYKVDKKIFKNTRGKSGKFTFIWKFVAPYKRLSWVMYWLAKEIKLKAGKTINTRFQNLFYDIIFSPQNTWVYKVKRFSYNYVYRNSRSTLAETYRTVTK
jgi:hypothetical protein